MQLLLIILSSLMIVQAGVIKESCEGVMIEGVYHEKEVLKSNIDRPYLLTVDYSTHTLFFSYRPKKGDDESRTARLDLNTKEFNDISEVGNGFAQTVDRRHHDVYIGGSDGIYKYHDNTYKVEFIGDKNIDIWNIYFKDVLYYSVFPSQFLYTLINGTSTRFKDLEDTKVDHFVMDDENNMFYTNATGLYSQKKGTKDAVLYEGWSNVGMRGMTTDISGNVYICLQDGVYKVNTLSNSIDNVVDIEDAFGVAFDDSNRMIYADATSLVRLKPNKNKTC